MDVVDIGSKVYFGNITAEHALPTLAITGISLVTGGLGGIAIAVVYAIYEDDLWHDYDKKMQPILLRKKNENEKSIFKWTLSGISLYWKSRPRIRSNVLHYFHANILYSRFVYYFSI